MKNKFWLILILGLVSGCSLIGNGDSPELKMGKYYIGNRLIDDIVILRDDSTYVHIAKNDKGVFYRKKPTWEFHGEKITLNNYIRVFDDETLELLDTTTMGEISFTIQNDYLSIEYEDWNYYRERR